MNLERTKHYRFITAIALFLMAAISYYFYLYQQKYPPCCDAISYLGLASGIEGNGFIESQIALRTFAYPLFLTGVAKISTAIAVNYSLLIFIFQFLIYAVAVINTLHFFTKEIKSTLPKGIILVLLCGNIYVAPYIASPLTDSIYISLCLIVVTNICRLFSNTNPQYDLIFITTLLVALAIVVRPTAIWLLAPLFFYFTIMIFNGNINYFKLASVLVVAAVPLFVQIWINHVRFDVFTFFPATDLGTAQVAWGINHIKYATWMGNGPTPNYYPSSGLINVVPGETGLTIQWYFNNILDGMKLVIVKFVGAFDFDYLVPYPYFRNPNFWLPSICSFAIMFFGVCGVIYHAVTNNIAVLGNRFFPGIIFISWGAVTLVSALELRFTLPILSYFMIVSVLYIYELKARQLKKVLVLSIGGFLIAMPVLIKIASFVRDQSAISG